MKYRSLALLMLSVPLSSGAVESALAQAPAAQLADGPPAAAGEPKRYRLAGQQDVASWLLLWPNGRFEYMLAAGALDEQAVGRWTRTGDTIFLTTLPKPKPAEFSLLKSERIAGAPLSVKVTLPNGRGIAGIDLRITFQGGEDLTGYTQEDGWTLADEDKRIPQQVELAVLMHGLRSKPFPLNISRANSLTFLLTPNQLGIVDFQDVPISVTEDQLIMRRDGSALNYRIDLDRPDQ
jgi:hypothetical protein